MEDRRGKLVVISGPSGVGRTTLLRKVLAAFPALVPSVSATTRPPRAGERDGVDYHFLSVEAFERRRAAGEFLECCQVYGRQHWYGTLVDEVAPRLAAGKWVVLEIDVEGTLSILEKFPQAITIFIEPSRPDQLLERLRGRGTESPEACGGGLRAGFRRGERDGRNNHDQTRSQCMIDELREEEIVNKVGGRFKLSTLIQKRLVALNAGGRPLVDVDTDDKMQIVIEEIKQDKIFLDTSMNLRITGESTEAGGPLDFDPTIL